MKIAKLFEDNQSQFIILPKEFCFDGNEVFIKKIGNAVILLPAQNPWQPLFLSLNKFSDDFMESRNQPV